MSDTAARVDGQLKAAGIPIVGVSIGTEIDRSTWKPQFAPGATQTHRDQAARLITNYTAPTAAVLAEEQAQRDTMTKGLKAVARALHESIPSPTLTLAQLQDRIKAIYKGLP